MWYRCHIHGYREKIIRMKRCRKIQKLIVTSLHTDTAAGEADEVGTDAEPSTALGSTGESGCEEVQDAEGGGGHERDGEDLTGVQLLARDEVRSACYDESLENILEYAQEHFL
jgi:hypothetical protein